MTALKSTRFVYILAAFLPAGAIFLAMPALAAAPANREALSSIAPPDITTSLSLPALDDTAETSPPAERIKLAAKLSTVVKGAAVGSRLARGSKKSEGQEKADKEAEAEAEAEPEADAGNSSPDGTATPSGPFKLVIPSQGEPADQNAASQAAPAAGATPATPPAASTSGPVRTILDRNNQNAAAPASTSIAIPATAQQQTEKPPIKDAADSGCIAGCYAPTSTQMTGPAARRAAATPAAAPQNGIECLAGCDGVNGKPLPRATSGAATSATPATSEAAAASSPQSGSNRVVIMRGNSRTKSYGVSQ